MYNMSSAITGITCVLTCQIGHILKNTHSVTFYTVICMKSVRMRLKGHTLMQKWHLHDITKTLHAQ